MRKIDNLYPYEGGCSPKSSDRRFSVDEYIGSTEFWEFALTTENPPLGRASVMQWAGLDTSYAELLRQFIGNSITCVSKDIVFAGSSFLTSEALFGNPIAGP